MVCQKPILTHCRAQTNVHNSCVPRTWRRQASSQITLSSSWNRNQVPVFREPQIRNGRTFSRRASTHALTIKGNGLFTIYVDSCYVQGLAFPYPPCFGSIGGCTCLFSGFTIFISGFRLAVSVRILYSLNFLLGCSC